MRDAEMFLERALIDEGLLDPGAIADVRRYALKHDLDLVDALVGAGLLTPRDIALTRALMFEAPYVALAEYQPCHDNAKLLPKSVAQRHCVFPLFVIDNVLTLAMEDPLNLEATDQVRQITRCEIDPVLCERDELRSLISRAYSLNTGHDAGSSTEEAKERVSDLLEETAPIVAAVNQLLADAVAERASDVHINPDEDRVHLRFRIDGVLHEKQGPPLAMHAGIVQRLKVMAHLDLTQTRRPQDGRFRFHPGKRDGHGGMRDNRSIDVRISTVPTVCGENVVLRMLSRATSVPTFSELGFAGSLMAQMEELLTQPYGMLLVSGPTGSGKTTTLYAALSKLNHPSRNLMTIEDPVEIRMPYVRQIQAHPDIGLTFASALRSILRQDPDVVLVGEIRDAETAGIALQAALTGHMVLSTVHTNDSAGAVARLRDFGLHSFVINSALLGVIAQRLLRRVCEQCTQPQRLDTLDPLVRRRLGLDDESVAKGAGFVRGAGCRTCGQTGYRGRIGAFELLAFTTQVREAVEAGCSTERIRQVAHRAGMRAIWQDGMDKARLGLTTLEEVASIAAICHLQFEDAQEQRKAA